MHRIRCALALFTLLPGFSLACSCVSSEGRLEDLIKNAIDNADSVLLARAVSVNRDLGGAGAANSLSAQQLSRFETVRTWKGAHGKQLLVITYAHPTLCGKTFSENAEYLLYLYGPDERGHYHTNSCSRTTSVSHAEKEILLLDETRRGSSNTALGHDKSGT